MHPGQDARGIAATAAIYWRHRLLPEIGNLAAVPQTALVAFTLARLTRIVPAGEVFSWETEKACERDRALEGRR